MHERLKEARKYLKLSQEFVARQMHLPDQRSARLNPDREKLQQRNLRDFLNCME